MIIWEEGRTQNVTFSLEKKNVVFNSNSISVQLR